MTTPHDIRQMLEQANHHEWEAKRWSWRGEGDHSDSYREHVYEKEREHADAALSLRVMAWALVQADPSLKPPGMHVPVAHMPKPRVVDEKILKAQKEMQEVILNTPIPSWNEALYQQGLNISIHPVHKANASQFPVKTLSAECG